MVPTVKVRMVTLIVVMTSQGILLSKILSDETTTSVVFCSFMQELISKLNDVSGMTGSYG